MLVLSRKRKQKIFIGQNIEVVVVKIQGDNVSIGIKAPQSLSIYHEEVLLEIEKENTVGMLNRDTVDTTSLLKGLRIKV